MGNISPSLINQCTGDRGPPVPVGRGREPTVTRKRDPVNVICIIYVKSSTANKSWLSLFYSRVVV